MALYNYATAALLKLDLTSNYLSDSSIMNSDLDGLETENINWNEVQINNSNCNDSVFAHSNFNNCNFFRSNLINACFKSCSINSTTYNGISFIKVKNYNSKFNNTIYDSCTLQRSEFIKSTIQSCTFKDFEGLYSKIQNSFFYNSTFEISYGSGMNGFSSSKIENCIFMNCNFKGFPLRGATLENCTFINCYGEITDDVIATNVYCLPYFTNMPSIQGTKLKNKDAALQLLSEVKNG